MAFKAGEGFVEFTAEDSPFRRAVGRIRRSMVGLRNSMRELGRHMRRAFIAAGIGMGVAVKQAGDAAEVVSKFKAVFKEQSEAAEESSVSIARSVGRSKFAVMEYMAALQDTFVPLGYSREEGKRLSTTLTQLAIDMASFSDKSDSAAIRDLQSALVGNHETVRKYGIIISESSLKLELMRMGMAKNVQAATEQQKVQARMNIILRGTADAQGDAERTAGSFNNSVKRLKGALHELSVTLGSTLLPHLAKMATWLAEALPAASAKAGAAWEKLRGPLMSIWLHAKFAFTNLLMFVELAMLKSTLSTVTFVDKMRHFFTVVIPDFLGWFFRNWRQVFTDIWNLTKTIFTNLYNNVVNFFANLMAYIFYDVPWESMWTPLTEGFKSALEELPQYADRPITEMEKNLGTRIKEMKGLISDEYKRSVLDPLEEFYKPKTPTPEEAPGGPGGPAGGQAAAARSAIAKTGFAGLTQAWKEIAGAGQKPEVQQVDLQKQMVEKLEQQKVESGKQTQELREIKEQLQTEQVAVLG